MNCYRCCCSWPGCAQRACLRPTHLIGGYIVAARRGSKWGWTSIVIVRWGNVGWRGKERARWRRRWCLRHGLVFVRRVVCMFLHWRGTTLVLIRAGRAVSFFDGEILGRITGGRGRRYCWCLVCTFPCVVDWFCPLRLCSWLQWIIVSGVWGWVGGWVLKKKVVLFGGWGSVQMFISRAVLDG